MANCAASRIGTVAVGLALICLVGAGSARAQQEQPTAGEVFSEFLACDALSLPTDRLICYETALKVMKRRFGVTGGRGADRDLAPLLGNRSGDSTWARPSGRRAPPSARAMAEEEMGRRFEATIVAARTDQVGHWIFTLDNGQVWKAADGTWLKHTDYEGKTVVAKRGWMGGWRFKILDYREVGRFKRIR